MFSRLHAEQLFDSTEQQLHRAGVLAAQRQRDRRAELGNIKRDHRQREVNASTTIGSDNVDATVSVDAAGVASLEKEVILLEAIVDKMILQLQRRHEQWRQGTKFDGKPLLGAIAKTMSQVKASTPLLHREMHATCEKLWNHLIIATIAAEMSVMGLQQLATALSVDAMHQIRGHVLTSFLNDETTGDAISTAPPSVVALAMTQPQFRTAFAERAVAIGAACAAERRTTAADAPLARMLGVFPAVGRCGVEPSVISSWLRGLVAPQLTAELEAVRIHGGGAVLATPELLHSRLYKATLQPELKALAQYSDEQATAAAPTDVPLSAAWTMVGDAARTILYRVLLFVQAAALKRRSLESTRTLQRHAAAMNTSTNAGGTAGAAQSHQELVQLIGEAAASRGLYLCESPRTLDGHTLYELHRDNATDDADTTTAAQVVDFYVHRGIIFACKHAPQQAAAASAFQRLHHGAAGLLKLVCEK